MDSHVRPRDLPVSQQTLLLSVFKHRLQSLASKLNISWDSIGCSLCSSEYWLGVSVRCRSKWVQFPPTSLPSSELLFIFWNHFLLLFYYSCPNFPPALLCPSPSQLPQSIPALLSMSMGHSYMFFVYTLCFLSPISPLLPHLWSLVRLFLISMSLVLFCLLVYFVH